MGLREGLREGGHKTGLAARLSTSPFDHSLRSQSLQRTLIFYGTIKERPKKGVGRCRLECLPLGARSRTRRRQQGLDPAKSGRYRKQLQKVSPLLRKYLNRS